jgi:D-inositol-3-phosphate glycosyltransferase
LRIVFLSHYALPHVGGIETAIDGLATELARRGHEVVHVTSNAGFSESASPRGAYRVVRVPALNTLERRLDVPYPFFGRKLVTVLRSELRAADVVHAHGFLYQTSVTAMLLSRLGLENERSARVLTEHVGHVHYESRLIDGLESLAIATVGRWTVRSVDAIVVYNGRVAGEIVQLAPGRRVHFIGNGVDSRRFRPPDESERAALRREAGWSDGLPRVLFVGRLVAKKGVDLVLSVADLARNDLEIVLVGPGTPKNASSRNVRLLGVQPPERLAKLYRAGDVLLLPSRGEGFPLVVQEAMASGLPVVMCADPSYAHHLDGAGEGVRLVDPDAEALTAAIRSLVRSHEDWRTASRAARDHAQRAYSWTRVADEHEALYERVCRDR